MKQVHELIPWKVTDISVYPYGTDYWSMNPSIHLDNGTWRCVARIVDYAMPGGVTIRSKNVRSGQQTRNAMVILDPTSWKPIQIFKMHEKDGYPRETSPHAGFEDMRIFRTDKGGLQGIAASLHLKREKRSTTEGATKHQPPEQVLLSFDGEYNITAAAPIRGDGWSGSQKNWAPFDNCVEPRFLFAIDKGVLFGAQGALHGDEARVVPSATARTVSPIVEAVPFAAVAPEPAPAPAPARAEVRARPPDRRPSLHRGGDVRILRGGRLTVDAMSSRPSSRHAPRHVTRRVSDDSSRTMGGGRTLVPKYSGLRGGTQLVRVGEDVWLGVGHSMRFLKGLKSYWHVFFSTNSRGKVLAVSEQLKLAPEGIEFAAGMAIDGDRVVISFGVDDMACRLGETSLSAVMGILRPVDRA